MADCSSNGRSIAVRQNRIYGGVESEQNAWPWIVSLTKADSGGHFCGATILADEWIITAAHCCDELSTADIIAKVGEFDFASVSGNERIVKVVKLIQHPQYG